jgi:predicted DCC family thiol-disulfide oxidoreductase YuxK
MFLRRSAGAQSLSLRFLERQGGDFASGPLECGENRMQHSNPIILYDGVCGLCNRFVRFVLKRDHKGQFRFAALQSKFARTVLERHGLNPDGLDTVYLVLDCGLPTEHLLSRNDAAAAVLGELGGFWRFWAALLDLLPRRFRDWRYTLVARNRYRFFGRHDSCPLPDPKHRHKFLDAD